MYSIRLLTSVLSTLSLPALRGPIRIVAKHGHMVSNDRVYRGTGSHTV